MKQPWLKYLCVALISAALISPSAALTATAVPAGKGACQQKVTVNGTEINCCPTYTTASGQSGTCSGGARPDGTTKKACEDHMGPNGWQYKEEGGADFRCVPKPKARTTIEFFDY